MFAPSFDTAPQFPLGEQIKVFPRQKERKGKKQAITFFYSPKTARKLAIKTESVFVLAILFEGDVSVHHYEITQRQEPLHLETGVVEVEFDAKLTMSDGRKQWIVFEEDSEGNRHGSSGSGDKRKWLLHMQAAEAHGAQFRRFTRQDLVGKEYLFDNWLHLCAMISRCRSLYLDREASHLNNRLRIQTELTLQSLLEIPEIDRAKMLAVVAKALQSGLIATDLEKRLFSLDSVLCRRTA